MSPVLQAIGLAIVCQLPSLRAWGRLVPAMPLAAWAAWTMLCVAGYVWLLRTKTRITKPRNQTRNHGKESERNSFSCFRDLSCFRDPCFRATALGVALAGTAWFAYPIADGLRAAGAGSDADDSLVHIALSVARGRDPYAELTYLGHTITQGMAWATLWLPFAWTGAVWLAVPAWIVGSAIASGRAAPFLAIGMSSAALWEGVITGSDPVAIGAAIVIVAVLAHRFAHGARSAGVAGVAAGVVGTSRLVFAGFPLVVAALLVQRGRSTALSAAIAGLAITGGELAARLVFAQSMGPEVEWTLGDRLLGRPTMLLMVVSWAAIVAIIVWRRPQKLDAWLAVSALAYAPAILIAAGASLAEEQFVFANWYGASYLLVLLPPLVASVLVSGDYSSRS